MAVTGPRDAYCGSGSKSGQSSPQQPSMKTKRIFPGASLREFRTSWLDWKLGGRMLLKYPGLSIIGGMTLAAAIALGAGFFEFAWEMNSPRLPLDEGDRIV